MGVRRDIDYARRGEGRGGEGRAGEGRRVNEIEGTMMVSVGGDRKGIGRDTEVNE